MTIAEAKLPNLDRDRLVSAIESDPNIGWLEDTSLVGSDILIFVTMRPLMRVYDAWSNLEPKGVIKRSYPAVMLLLQQQKEGMHARIQWKGHLNYGLVLLVILMPCGILIHEFYMGRLATYNIGEWAVIFVVGLMLVVAPGVLFVRWFRISLRDIRLLRGVLATLGCQ